MQVPEEKMSEFLKELEELQKKYRLQLRPHVVPTIDVVPIVGLDCGECGKPKPEQCECPLEDKKGEQHESSTGKSDTETNE